MVPKYTAMALTPTNGTDKLAVVKTCQTALISMLSTEKVVLPQQDGFTSIDNINLKKKKPLLETISIFKQRKIQKKEQSNRSKDEETTFNSPCFTDILPGKCTTRPTLYPIHVQHECDQPRLCRF